MIQVNGVELPAPSKYQVSEMDIMKAERTQTGALSTDYTATKVKISLEWPALTSEEQALIMGLVANKNGSLSVTYMNQYGQTVTGSFYSGDRSASCIVFHDGVPTWQGLKFDLIER